MYYSPKRIVKALYWFCFGSSAQRRRVRLECAQTAAYLFGDFPLGDDHKLWLEDKEFRKKFQKLCPISPYSLERKWTLKELAKQVSPLPGSMAECGCYEGASAYFMAQENPDTTLHIFDSFEGLSEPSDVDRTDKKDERQWKKGDMSAPEQAARTNLSSFSKIRFHKGWIPEKFHIVEKKSFKLVHIDVDLYKPTKDSLEFFFPRLVKNGIIVLDDYGSSLCPGAHKASDEFMKEKNINIIHLPTMQGIIIKQ